MDSKGSMLFRKYIYIEEKLLKNTEYKTDTIIASGDFEKI